MKPVDFPPPRRRGLLIHLVIILVLVILVMIGLWGAFHVEIGLAFILYLLLTLAAFIPLPFFGYRAYALLNANYSLSRDNLSLKWGLRTEELPLSEVEWVRPVSALTTPLRLPHIYLPGAILGLRRLPDVGLVEFLASDVQGLLLIATARRVFAISPSDPAAFVREFQRTMEMGSLAPTAAHSVYPSFIFTRAWEHPLVRYLWMSGLLLNIGLLIWVSLLIPSLTYTPLGFDPTGEPLGPVPSAQLMLLPLLSLLFTATGWISGVFFYNKKEQQPLAFIIWISSALTALLFLLAVLFLITTPF